MSEELVQLTPELKAFIAEWKSKPGNLIMVLHKIQQAYGYIPRDIAIEISELLEIPLAKIYGVITFYNFFQAPEGRQAPHPGVPRHRLLPARRRRPAEGLRAGTGAWA
jgi:NADH:ubiquinone oxidoreductase subunit E